MPLALVALFAAAFAIGTTEFVIAGILPAVAADLHISIPTAGNLVSLYALGVAVGGPLLALWTGQYSRKRLLLVYVAIFTAGHALCALAPSYDLLLASRVMIALVHGAYFGTAMILAASVVPENRRGFAASLLLAGLTIANIVGVPLGTAIGTEFHWRITFWAIGALGVLAGILILLLLPSDRPVAPARGNLRRELNALTREPYTPRSRSSSFRRLGSLRCLLTSRRCSPTSQAFPPTRSPGCFYCSVSARHLVCSAAAGSLTGN